MYVPPYMSLVTSYQALVGPPPGTAAGAIEAAGCDGVEGFAWEPTTPDTALSVRLAFDGEAGGLTASEIDVVASEKRDDLCDSLGSCDHGFSSRLPLSVADGKTHDLFAYGLDAAGEGTALLDGSPLSFSCDYPLPASGRRAVKDYAVFSSWGFSAFWDVIQVDDGALSGLAEGAALPDEPTWVRDGGGGLWLVEGGIRRELPAGAESAWHVDPEGASPASADELAAWEKGPALGERPVLVQGSGPELFLVEDAASSGTGEPLNPWVEASAEAQADASCACGVVGAPRARGPLVTPLALAAAGLALAAWATRRRRRGAQPSQAA